MEVPAATEIRSAETEELIKKLTEQKHHETNLKQLAILKLEEVKYFLSLGRAAPNLEDPSRQLIILVS